ncbi:MAG: amidohydrolase [Pirellulales bacterium]|nr:amidohydrolase [Pirellulales bacterium]
MQIIFGLPLDSPEGFLKTLAYARSLPVAVRAYHCLVLPDALMSRSEPEWEICYDPLTLEMTSRYQHVYFQISGMKMFCPYPHEPLYTWITSAIETFGPDRLLWGSNYPVVGDTDDYLADLRLVTGGQLPFSKPSLPAIAGGNARRLWFDK